MTELPPKKCQFFTLPPELRLEVYKLVLADFTIDPSERKLRELPLVQVNVAIREESVGIFNKRLSAILDERWADLTDAQLESESCKQRYDLGLGSRRAGLRRWTAAMDRCNHIMDSIERDQIAVKIERKKLRKEGFRV